MYKKTTPLFEALVSHYNAANTPRYNTAIISFDGKNIKVGTVYGNTFRVSNSTNDALKRTIDNTTTIERVPSNLLRDGYTACEFIITPATVAALAAYITTETRKAIIDELLADLA